MLHPSGRHASPSVCPPSSCSGSCCLCPVAAPGVSWQLPACSHHGCCRHQHIQADALVTVILLLMGVTGTSPSHIKGQKLFPSHRHRAIWHPLLPLPVTILPATMPAATITSLAQGVWQSPSEPMEAASQWGQPWALKESLRFKVSTAQPSISLPYLFLEMWATWKLKQYHAPPWVYSVNFSASVRNYFKMFSIIASILSWCIVFLFLFSSRNFLFFFLFGFMAYRILVLHPEIERIPHASEAQSLTHWTAREVPRIFLTKLVRFKTICRIQDGRPTSVLSWRNKKE